MTGPALQARGLTVAFNGRTVFDDVDLDVAPGEIVGITGASGCGKTTLLRVLAGLQRPGAGEVRYHGSSVPWPASIALLAQHPRLVCNPRWTLHQIIAEPATIARRPMSNSAVAQRVGLDAELLTRYPGQVSDGQLQRACLGRTLVQQPEFLLCDEPTAMLDPIATSQVVTLIQNFAERGATIALVSHDPELIAALSTWTQVLSQANKLHGCDVG